MRFCLSPLGGKLTTLYAPCLFIGTCDQASSARGVAFIADVFGSNLDRCTSYPCHNVYCTVHFVTFNPLNAELNPI